ncbi:hypothetical protein CPG37_02780 [Malaciobacter canalis]|uniref:Uncharacterized protein n=1 Tax=Malaciobacter canalis TaxID=1912871 RepID=A0ABX4LS29_9BACT|nr:hypothetical protein [Malaciobacter canalis]PHO10786.1 hypothetical protein CPG37_02780 [Malaciobacter canalis]QEE33943.1 hypothetical protein ACAN_2505 [Malaciobacter canalis]
MKVKKDNLKEFRDKRVEINVILVQKTIDKIVALNGELSANNVSKTSYLIADSVLGEKGISPSAISKNIIYKQMIQKAQQEMGSNEGPKGFKTDGDIRIELFSTKIEMEKIKKENKLLREVLKKYGGNLNSFDMPSYEEIEKNQLIQQASKGLIQRLYELGLAEYDMKKEALVLVQLGDILLYRNGYKLIMEDS